MVKKQKVWICSSCGHVCHQGIGKCPSCGEWNTMEDKRMSIEEIETLSMGPLSANDNVSEKAVWEGLHSEDNADVSKVNDMPLHPSTVVCYKCNGVIPKISEYCPRCGIKLYTICTQCNNKYSSEYSYCFLCGNSRENKNFDLKETSSPIKSKNEWRCDICGYVYYGQLTPTECPMCHVIGCFVNEKTPKYKCLVCGWVHNGDTLPSECPLCHVGKENFERVNE